MKIPTIPMQKICRIAVTALLLLVVMLPVIAQDGSPSFSHVVSYISGDVKLHRAGWGEGIWVPVTVGMEIFSNDLIDASAGEVRLECADGTTTLILDLSNPTCQDIPSNDGSTMITTKLRRSAPVVIQSPYLLAPRGKIISTRPLVRWMAIDGAASYALDVFFEGVSIFGTEKPRVDAAEYQIETDLLEGRYTVQVVALNKNGVSIAVWTTDSANTRFDVVVAPENFKAMIQLIDAKEFPANVMSWMPDYQKALIYSQYSFISEAADILAGLAQRETGLTAAVYLNYGEFLDALALYPQALLIYDRAATLADLQGDIETLANAYLYASYVPGDVPRQWCQLQTALPTLATFQSTIMPDVEQHKVDLETQLNGTPPSDCAAFIET